MLLRPLIAAMLAFAPASFAQESNGGLLTEVTSGRRTLTAAQWQQLKALYDGEVEYMDRCYGQLADGLKARGLAYKPVYFFPGNRLQVGDRAGDPLLEPCKILRWWIDVGLKDAISHSVDGANGVP